VIAVSEERAIEHRSRQPSARQAATARTARRPQRRAPGGVDDALLAVQHLAGNAAVGGLLARERRDAPPGGPVPLPPELSETPSLVLRLPSNAAELLTVAAQRGRIRRRTAVRLEGTAGSGDRAVAPVAVATSARTSRLTGTLQGLQPLVLEGPLSGVSAALDPELTFALRVGRVDLARSGNDASVTIDDGTVALTVRFAAGEVRLTGEVDATGEAPGDWDIEVELDHRRCTRLLAARPRGAGRGAADATTASPPPEEPRRRPGGASNATQTTPASGPGTDAGDGRPQARAR